MRFAKRHHDISIRAINNSFVVIIVLFSCGVLFSNHLVLNKYERAVQSQQTFIACEDAATALQKASDDLSICIYNYVDTQSEEYLWEYYSIINRRVREKELANAEQYAVDCSSLQTALRLSNELAQRETHAFSLIARADDAIDSTPAQVQNYVLPYSEFLQPKEEKIKLARQLIHDSAYNNYKQKIYDQIDTFEKEVLSKTENNLLEETHDISFYLRHLYWVAAGGNLLVILLAYILYKKVTVVLSRYINSVSKNETILPEGTVELKYLAGAFNDSLARQKTMQAELRRLADLDALTDIPNRRSLETFMMKKLAESNAAGVFIFLDIDEFKNINDTFGHDAGDAVLKFLAGKIQSSCSERDYFGRFGGDEFAVWLDDADRRDMAAVETLIAELCGDLPDPKIQISVSAGATYCKAGEAYDDVLKRADMALYAKKRSGKRGVTFYENL